jgi:aspartate aminotransferase
MNVRGLEQSATIDINDRCRQLQREGKQVYRLGLGQSPFPVPVPVVEELRQHAHEKDYLPAAGLRELRAAVSQFHEHKDGTLFRPDHILIGPGSKELMFILQLVFYGELIVPTPCWVSYVPQAQIVGRPVRLIHTRAEDQWRMTPDLLAEHCEREKDDFRPRILVLNYPGNPDGRTYGPDELKALAEVARRFHVILLSDEIYGQLHHKGEHVSVARFYPEGTIVSSGLSKWCGAGGWRLGTFAFPDDLDWLMDKMAAVASETYTSVSAPIQYAAVRAFRGGVKLERYLWQARRILAALGGQCAEAIRRAKIRTFPPQGAFYLFLDFTPHREPLRGRGIVNSTDLCERLLEETGVAVLPGAAFARPPEELTARLAYVDFDGARALAAGETIPIDQPLPDDFTGRYCGNVLEAVDKICHWIQT